MRRHTTKYLHVIIGNFLVDLLGEGPHSLSRVERLRILCAFLRGSLNTIEPRVEVNAILGEERGRDSADRVP